MNGTSTKTSNHYSIDKKLFENGLNSLDSRPLNFGDHGNTFVISSNYASYICPKCGYVFKTPVTVGESVIVKINNDSTASLESYIINVGEHLECPDPKCKASPKKYFETRYNILYGKITEKKTKLSPEVTQDLPSNPNDKSNLVKLPNQSTTKYGCNYITDWGIERFIYPNTISNINTNKEYFNHDSTPTLEKWGKTNYRYHTHIDQKKYFKPPLISENEKEKINYAITEFYEKDAKLLKKNEKYCAVPGCYNIIRVKSNQNRKRYCKDHRNTSRKKRYLPPKPVFTPICEHGSKNIVKTRIKDVKLPKNMNLYKLTCVECFTEKYQVVEFIRRKGKNKWINNKVRLSSKLFSKTDKELISLVYGENIDISENNAKLNFNASNICVSHHI